MQGYVDDSIVLGLGWAGEREAREERVGEGGGRRERLGEGGGREGGRREGRKGRKGRKGRVREEGVTQPIGHLRRD